MSWCKTFRKSTKQILRKMHHWRMNRQTNGWTKRTDFIGLFCKDGSLIMFFGNMRIKPSWIIWLDSEKIWKGLIQEKGTQSTWISVHRAQKQWFLANLRTYCFIITDKLIDFYFFMLTWKGSWQKRGQSWKSQTLSWITNYDPLSRTLAWHSFVP